MKTNNEHLILAYAMDELNNQTLVDQSSNQFNAIVHGQLAVVNEDGRTGLKFSCENEGFIELPKDILNTCERFTAMCWIKPQEIKMWQRIFDFGPRHDQNFFFTLKGAAEAPMLSLHNGPLERFGSAKQLEEGKWQHLAVTVDGNQASILVNGEVVASSQTITVKPNSIVGEQTKNYIGKSRHDDPLFEGVMSDFRLYNQALKAEEIYEAAMAEMEDMLKAEFLLNTLEIGDLSLITSNLLLPQKVGNQIEVTWSSSCEEIISNEGLVTRPLDHDQLVTLIATITVGSETATKEFLVNVVKQGEASIHLNVNVASKSVDIPKTFVGLFFEDINYAADGGLYAELVNNRSFEFGSWYGKYSQFSDYFYAWEVVGDIEGVLTHEQGTENPIHPNNPHYLRVNVEAAGHGIGIANTGFEGIAIKENEVYHFSSWVRNICSQANLIVRLESSNGTVYAEQVIKNDQLTTEWSKVEAILIPNQTDQFARLTVLLDREGTLDLDMISLFPADTFNGRQNGLRKDLAQMLKDINPGFIRFPGGCIVEGFYLDNAYNWKDTVGPVEQRKMNWNRWEGGQPYAYNQSYGLGFMEYFILAEDLGAEPLPILNCGMSCQFQGAQLAEDFEPYIQDCLDLIEFANGDETTYWGQKRIEYGHKEPFNLKYLGVGNEQWVDHEKHGDMDCLTIYEMFRNRIKEVYPDINLITTSGPFPYGKEFDDAYQVITPKIKEYIEKGEVFTEIIDEHFYMSPEWFLESMERYDHYPRYEDGKSGKVFVGEYACHTNRTGFSSQGINNVLAALSEAAFLTSAERNADVIEMTTYAPLFAKKDRTQWGPDLIWFDNTSAFGSPSYYVQKMYGNHLGDYVLDSKLTTRSSVVQSTDYPVYTVASYLAETKEVIVKLVNLNQTKKEVEVQLDGISKVNSKATEICLSAQKGLEDVNSFDQPTYIQDVETAIEVKGTTFRYEVKPHTFTVLRLRVEQ